MGRRCSLLSNIYRELYNEICEERGWRPRRHIIEALDKLYNYLDVYEPKILFLDLPTGYGKTTLTEVLLRTLIKYYNDLNYSKIIHVLPLKSIIHQLTKRLKEYYGATYVGEQHMGIHDSPYLVKKCVVTTFDTFMLNMIKLSPPELSKAFKYGITHHYFSRSMIYSSLLIFDEAHLFLTFGDEIRDRLAILLSIIHSMLSIGVPIILSTASIPNNIRRFIIDRLKKDFGKSTVDIISYKDDPGFNSIANNIVTIKISEARIKDILKSDIKKTLIIFNTVSNAVEFYRKLATDEDIKRLYKSIVLLHGMLPEKIKLNVIECIENEPDLIVATHSIEAGVDISYERLITLPAHPDSLLQRMGRVARRKYMDGEVILLGGDLDKVYGKYWNGYYDKLISLGLLKALSKETGEFRRIDLENRIRSFIDTKSAVNLNAHLYNIFISCEGSELIDVKDVVNAIKHVDKLIGMPIACYPYFNGNVQKDMKLVIDLDRAVKILKRYKVFIDYKRNISYNQALHTLIKGGYTRQLPIILISNGYIGIGMPMKDVRKYYYPFELDINLRGCGGD